MVIVHKEEFWLASQRNLKNDNVLDSLIDKIELQQPVVFRKYQGAEFPSIFGISKMKLHGYLVKLLNVFDDDLLIQLEYIMVISVLIPHPSKNEHLIWFLLVHY